MKREKKTGCSTLSAWFVYAVC